MSPARVQHAPDRSDSVSGRLPRRILDSILLQHSQARVLGQDGSIVSEDK